MKVKDSIASEINKIKKIPNETHKKQKLKRNKFLKDPKNKKIIDKVTLQMEVSKQLYNIRIKSNMTQKELAEKLHTSQSNLARIENGQNIRISTLYEYALACGKKVSISMK